MALAIYELSLERDGSGEMSADKRCLVSVSRNVEEQRFDAGAPVTPCSVAEFLFLHPRSPSRSVPGHPCHLLCETELPREGAILWPLSTCCHVQLLLSTVGDPGATWNGILGDKR